MIRLLIADDHPIVLNGIDALLQGSDMTVVARCSDGEEVLRAMEAEQPDILILDVQMPKRTGLDILRQLKSSGHPARAVLLTGSISDDQLLEAVRLGADGILLKESAPHRLLECIRVVREGSRWLDPEVTRRALDAAVRDNARRHGPAETPLTKREIEIVRLLARGLRNKEIARHVGITEGTVKMHLHNIYRKLQVESRTELLAYAHENGIVSD